MSHNDIPPGTPVARYAIATPVYSHSEINNSSNPDDLLGELLADLMHGRPLNPLTRHWLLKGVLRAIRRGESLDTALMLNGAGKATLQNRLLMIRRNEHLAAAVAAVSLDADVSTWERCCRLAPEVVFFVNDIWPKAKKRLAPADDWPTFKKRLWDAACTDMPLPATPGGLFSAIKQTPVFSPSKQGAKLLAQFL